jgi:alkanesulfonate monooxygenase SsuD/methylene tetrahydromethanopterin reductase-like flavin-dependent oxidoreductase (luciferase family)
MAPEFSNRTVPGRTLMPLEFGIFDHLDDNGIPLADLFETRLKLTEQYDRLGFRSYHIAEHHSTPLGMAPSPSVFLAAVAQHTKRLRFGPLLYVTPMYHPLRVAEEVVMLDHMSRGRLELGLGRGASPVEIAAFDVDPAKAPEINREATEVILKALTSDVVNHDGKYYHFKNVRIAARPLQQPYPPLWFAPIEPPRAADAARMKGHVVTLIPDAGVKALTDTYRAAWQAGGNAGAAMPLMGVFRHVVVAETDAKALAIARSAYRPWRENMEFLWKWGGVEFPIGGVYPLEFDALQAMGTGIAGAPETVRRYIESAVAATGITYFVCDMSFGSIPFEDASRSVDLFAREVMPHFQ